VKFEEGKMLSQFKTLCSAFSLLIILLVLATPVQTVLAQGDDSPRRGDPVTIIGTVESLCEDVVVDGYIITPAGAFRPATLNVGDVVKIEGVWQNPETIRASRLTVLESNEDAEAPPCDEEGDDEGDDDGDDDGDDEGVGVCNNFDHPLLPRLEDALGISADDVVSLRCEGFSFGEIIRALLLAEATGEEAEDILARRAAGEGWGVILRDYDVHPRDLAPGRVLNQNQAGENNGQNNGRGNSENNPGRGSGRK
jgi:hypothetical protein